MSENFMDLDENIKTLHKAKIAKISGNNNKEEGIPVDRNKKKIEMIGDGDEEKDEQNQNLLSEPTHNSIDESKPEFEKLYYTYLFWKYDDSLTYFHACNRANIFFILLSFFVTVGLMIFYSWEVMVLCLTIHIILSLPLFTCLQGQKKKIERHGYLVKIEEDDVFDVVNWIKSYQMMYFFIYFVQCGFFSLHFLLLLSNGFSVFAEFLIALISLGYVVFILAQLSIGEQIDCAANDLGKGSCIVMSHRHPEIVEIIKNHRKMNILTVKPFENETYDNNQRFIDINKKKVYDEDDVNYMELEEDANDANIADKADEKKNEDGGDK